MSVKPRSIESLCDYLKTCHQVEYVFFWGHRNNGQAVSKSCFSQWYPASFEEQGRTFETAEHYMMHHKALLFNDESAAAEALVATTPAAAKAAGRKVRGFIDERWEAHRFEIVVQANLNKFSQNAELRDFLLATGDDILVEASPVDRIWGIGLDQHDEACRQPELWRGLNLLGFALMEVRDRIKAGEVSI
ncbi:NADAR family protein [Spongorhabdus nitratireducens]